MEKCNILVIFYLGNFLTRVRENIHATDVMKIIVSCRDIFMAFCRDIDPRNVYILWNYVATGLFFLHASTFSDLDEIWSIWT